MKATNFILIWLYLFIPYNCTNRLPNYINVCKRTDPNLSACWQHSIELLQPYLKEKGIPELQIPSLQPLHIDKIILNQGSSSTIKFEAILTNLIFDGTSDFTVSDTKIDLNDLTVHTVMYFPRWIMHSHYTAKGRVLLFQFDSDGDVQGDFGGVLANGTWYLTTYEKNGKKHLKIDKSHIDVNVKSIYVHFGDLFKNNKELTETVNKAVMDNIDLIYDDFKPILSHTIESVFYDYSSKVYDAIPFDVLYPN